MLTGVQHLYAFSQRAGHSIPALGDQPCDRALGSVTLWSLFQPLLFYFDVYIAWSAIFLADWCSAFVCSFTACWPIYSLLWVSANALSYRSGDQLCNLALVKCHSLVVVAPLLFYLDVYIAWSAVSFVDKIS